MGRWTWQGDRDEVSLLGLAYSNRWNATDQIPSRLVEQQTLSRFGQVDPTLGGDTERHSLSLQWKRAHSATARCALIRTPCATTSISSPTLRICWRMRPPAISSNRSITRTVGGMDIEYARPTNALGAAHLVRVGTQGRYDDAAVALHGTTARVRYRTVRADAVQEGSLGAWTSIESRWTSTIRTITGLRGDAYRFRVNSDNALNSGTRSATIASPKFSLVYAPTSRAELYVGGGLGFHSNDARGSTITVDPVSGDAVDRVDPLVRSRGGEIGIRTSGARGFRSSASLWVLDLDSELLFVGDAGTTEPQGRTRRTGVTVASFWQPYRALTVDADVSFTRARFVNEPVGVQSVAGALNNVIAAGITWAPVSRGPFASLRVRHLGGYALIEDNSVRGTPTTLVNGALGTTVGRARVQASVFNLLGSRGSRHSILLRIARSRRTIRWRGRRPLSSRRATPAPPQRVVRYVRGCTQRATSCRRCRPGMASSSAAETQRPALP